MRTTVPADSSAVSVVAPPIWFLALCTASAVVGLTILTPAVPLIKAELGVSSAAVQQLLTVFMIALALGQLICGPISDRLGRRPVLLAGGLLYVIGSIGALVTNRIEWLIGLRIVQGLGAAACMSMGRAIVNDAFERSEAARQMSTISMVLAVAPALSIAFGGVLAETAGWKGTMVLLSAAGIAVLVSAWYLAAETNLNKLDKINPGTVAHAYREVLSNNRFLCWALSSGMQIGIFFSLNAFLAYQYQRHGYSLAEFGLWFALTPLFYLIGNTCNRQWFAARGLERAAMVGCVLSLVAVTALFVTQAIGMTHALSLALPCCLFGFSNGIVVANATVGAISESGRHVGTGTGIVGAWQMATGGISGAIIVALGGAQVFAVAAGALIVMSIVSVMSMLYVYRKSLH
jgi:DHA1 family bicyclomycin/chloramphenicol resistance-like MFS transporter